MMTEIPPRRRLSQAQEDYLKALYQLGGSQGSVSTSQVAERVGVSAASATEMITKLAGLGLVVHDRYRGVALTPNGLAVALEKLGLRLGAELVVLAESEYEGPIEVRVAGRRRQVPLGVARAVFVG